jgi:DNA-binding CsgD family transcriptional regulator
MSDYTEQEYPEGYLPGDEPEKIKRSSGCRKAPKRLSKVQREAAMMVANGSSNKEIAARVKCSVPTIQGWRRMDIFIECVELEQEHSLENTRRELSAQYCETAREAFEVLRNQLGGETYAAQNAARMIIDKFYNLADQSNQTSVEVRFTNMPVLGEAVRETRQADEINIVGLLKPEE